MSKIRAVYRKQPDGSISRQLTTEEQERLARVANRGPQVKDINDNDAKSRQEVERKG